MNIEQLIAALTKNADAIRAGIAEKRIPGGASGLYAIFVDDPKHLPEAFRTHLEALSTNLIYVGKAGDDLWKRLVAQDLRHENPSTFFRSLGAMLGYTPIPGSLKGKKNTANYKFSASDTKKIIEWVNEHLSVRVLTPVDDLDLLEKTIIGRLRPLLNLKDNRASLPQLKSLRAICRRIAAHG